MLDKKELWKRLFFMHDRMKLYYIQIFVLLLFVGPLSFLFNLSMWEEILSSEDNIRAFTMLVYIAMAFFGLIALLIYVMVWRFVFPRYKMIRAGGVYDGGRVYFSTTSPLAVWSIKKRVWCGAPAETEFNYLWVCTGMLNIFNPWGSMNKIWLPLDARIIRDVTELRVFEDGHKKKIISKYGNVEFFVDSNNSIFSSETDNTLVSADAKRKLKEMIKTSQLAAQASVSHVQKSLEHGAFNLSWDLKSDIDSIEKQGEGR